MTPVRNARDRLRRAGVETYTRLRPLNAQVCAGRTRGGELTSGPTREAAESLGPCREMSSRPRTGRERCRSRSVAEQVRSATHQRWATLRTNDNGGGT